MNLAVESLIIFARARYACLIHLAINGVFRLVTHHKVTV